MCKPMAINDVMQKHFSNKFDVLNNIVNQVFFNKA